MAVIRNIRVTVRHDAGTVTFTDQSDSIAKTVSNICELERCPENAIIAIKCTDIPVQYYKVIRYFKNSGKRQILHTNRSREEAMSLVAKYPSNPQKSFVGFDKQRSRYATTK